MGYCSKLYITDSYGSIVAMLDMKKTGALPDDWYDLFDQKYEKGIYMDMGGMEIPCDYSFSYKGEKIDFVPNIETHTDSCGQQLMYAEAADVYEWCKKNRKKHHMLNTLYQMLGALMSVFNQEYGGESLYVVHFGY